MNPVPCNWALYTTHISSEYVCAQFCATIEWMPNVLLPLELDFLMLAACSHIASKLANAYRNPGRMILFVTSSNLMIICFSRH